ncbi:MAG TPA: hypothetical protein VD816_04095, partial [Ohtaekwangia sp.]|nr:hypothetical protein [Ohtaekwangia sp.]
AIVFNDNEGIVTLYDKSSDELRAFNARTLVKFQMDSSKGERERVFYSLEFDGANTGMKRPEFFEVLHELDSFIVLVKIERLKTEARRDILEPRQSPILVKRASRKFTQTQIVYFLDMEGNFEPYLKILEKEIDGDLFDINEEHNHYINADLFRKYTGQHFPALVAYAKQNDLSFKRKEHIVLILDHYKRLARR